MVPSFGPISRKKLIRALRTYGFDGPYSGGRHEFMVKDTLVVHIPNPHRSDIGKALLARILKQAAISIEEWERL